MTRLRAESTQPFHVSIENCWGEAEAVLVAPVGCVVERPFENFVICSVLGGCRRRTWVSCGWAETGGYREIPGFRVMCFSWRIQTSAAR